MKKGVLLINLGTPDACSLSAVRKYLREFLMDPHVIQKPFWFRYLLVNGLIVPFRAKKTLAAYEQIWTTEGSPLLVLSENLKVKLGETLGEGFHVALGMRYGNPSIQSAMLELENAGVTECYVLPMYPQRADSTLKTAVEAIQANMNLVSYSTYIRPPFFDDTFYLSALKESVCQSLEDHEIEHLLFSFHGLPEAHILKSSPQCVGCLKSPQCEAKALDSCYRAQCVKTAESVAELIGAESYSVSFQSRLGRLPWIRPYTDETIQSLAQRGVKKLAVVCPAFTVDCLETLEEINMANRAVFLEHGGESFYYLPCLNDGQAWIDCLKSWVLDYFNKA